MPDHEPWRIERLAPETLDMSLSQLCALFGVARDTGASLGFAGRSFSCALRCAACGCVERRLQLVGGGAAGGLCPRCGVLARAAGFDTSEVICLGELSPDEAALSLRRLGARAGDVFTLRADGAARHYEIASNEDATGGDA
jgi:hypothetical protein